MDIRMVLTEVFVIALTIGSFVNIFIGDIHGRDVWKKIIKKHDDIDNIVFIGDYLDYQEEILSDINDPIEYWESLNNIDTLIEEKYKLKDFEEFENWGHELPLGCSECKDYKTYIPVYSFTKEIVINYYRSCPNCGRQLEAVK
jgi:hypothetical protein